MVQVQISDGRQGKQRVASGLCNLKYLMAFAGEGVGVDNWCVWNGMWKDGCNLTIYHRDTQLNSPASYLSALFVVSNFT